MKTATNQTEVGEPQAPAGAESDEWQHLDGHRFRVVHGAVRNIPGRDDVVVAASALQLADGRIDDGAAVEGPLMFVTVPGGSVNVAEARQLARLLMAVADEVDAWAGVTGA